MDEMSVNRNIFFSNSNQYNYIPGLHKNSFVIPKPKPKVRIIHLFPPEIIHTDVAHFRGIVQELTGKHNLLPQAKKRKIVKTPKIIAHEVPVMEQCGYIKAEEEEEEEDIWKNYINGFTETDDYFQYFEELPLLPPSLPTPQYLGHI